MSRQIVALGDGGAEIVGAAVHVQRDGIRQHAANRLGRHQIRDESRVRISHDDAGAGELALAVEQRQIG